MRSEEEGKRRRLKVEEEGEEKGNNQRLRADLARCSQKFKGEEERDEKINR